MIYKFTITFKSETVKSVSTIMYVSGSLKNKYFQKLTENIDKDPISDCAFITQENELIRVNHTDGISGLYEGTIKQYLDDNYSEEEQKMWLIGQTIAINTTNVEKVQVQAQ